MTEWVKYSPYGVAFGLPGCDTDSDGDCDAADITQIDAWIAAPSYDIRGDVDLDGDVDGQDSSFASTQYGTSVMPALPAGKISFAGAGGADNSIGYDGYVYNWPVTLYTIRFRHYSAMHGRWLERDPIGYVDGMNLFEYVGSDPFAYVDSFGLIGEYWYPVDSGGGLPDRWEMMKILRHRKIYTTTPGGVRIEWGSGCRSKKFREELTRAADQMCNELRAALSMIVNDASWNACIGGKGRLNCANDFSKIKYSRKQLISMLNQLINTYCSGKRFIRIEGDWCRGCKNKIADPSKHQPPHEPHPGIPDDDTHFPYNPIDGKPCPQEDFAPTIYHELFHQLFDTADTDKEQYGIDNLLRKLHECSHKFGDDTCTDGNCPLIR